MAETFVTTIADLALERRISRLQLSDDACLLKLTELVLERRPEYVAYLEANRLDRVMGEGQ